MDLEKYSVKSRGRRTRHVFSSNQCFLHCCLTIVDVLKKYRRYLFISESKQLVSSDFATVF